MDVLASRVDTLVLGYVLPIDPGWERKLEKVKFAAVKAKRAATDPRTGEVMEEVATVEVHLGGQLWNVRPYGGAGVSYLLENEAIQLGISPMAANGAPTVQAKLLSSVLWSYEPMLLVTTARAAALELCEDEGEIREVVQRIDLAVDFQGWAPRAFHFEQFCCPGHPTTNLHPDKQRPEAQSVTHERKKRRTRRLEEFYLRKEMNPDDEAVEETLDHPQMWKRWKLTGFRFGKGDVVVRLYDKTEEIKVSDKLWMRKVWADNPAGYSPDHPVWRLEVQIRRGFLKAARLEDGMGLDTVEATFGALGDLWRYTLGNRVRLTLADKSRLSNSTEHPVWSALRLTNAIDSADQGVPITRLAQDSITAEQLTPKLRGYLAKRAALTGKDSLADVLVDTGVEVESLCVDRDEPFEKLVRQKRKRRAAVNLVRAEFDARRIETMKRRASSNSLQE